jgi:hypothetical protein
MSYTQNRWNQSLGPPNCPRSRDQSKPASTTRTPRHGAEHEMCLEGRMCVYFLRLQGQVLLPVRHIIMSKVSLTSHVGFKNIATSSTDEEPSGR